MGCSALRARQARCHTCVPHCVHCWPGATTPTERGRAAGRLAGFGFSRPLGRPLRLVPLPVRARGRLCQLQPSLPACPRLLLPRDPERPNQVPAPSLIAIAEPILLTYDPYPHMQPKSSILAIGRAALYSLGHWMTYPPHPHSLQPAPARRAGVGPRVEQRVGTLQPLNGP